MSSISIRPVTKDDIPTWTDLSHEYDGYVSEIVSDLAVWYEGDKNNIAFMDYMKAKINQNEAFMAVDMRTNNCLGIVAFSIRNNRITFFGISHAAEFSHIGDMLTNYALNSLDNDKEITVNVVKSNAPHIIKEKELFIKHGFTVAGSQLENSVPVYKMARAR